MRHDDGPHDTDSLGQLNRTAALAARNEHPLQQLDLVWTHHHILTNRRTRTGLDTQCRTREDPVLGWMVGWMVEWMVDG